MTRTAGGVLLLILHAAGSAAAQTPAPSPDPRTYEQMWDFRLGRIEKLRGDAPMNLEEQIEGEVDVNANLTAFLLFAHAQSLTTNVRAIEGARTDKQLGAPAATAGSTSLVSKGSVPRILAFAVEHGAATQTSDATSATIRGNAIGWLELLRGQGFQSAGDGSVTERFLRKVSYSVTFNAAPATPAATEERPDRTEVETQIDKSERQLTAYSVRYSFLDQRDPRRPDNRAAGQALLGSREGTEVFQAIAFLRPVMNSAEYRQWLDGTKVALSSPSPMSRPDLEGILYARLEILRQLMIRGITDFNVGANRFVAALLSFEAARAVWFDRMQQRFVLAAELVRTRPPSEAGTSTYRLIGEGRVGGTNLDLTVNVACTRQDAGVALIPEPVETEGWRDIQLGLQAELPLGKRPPITEDAGGVGRPALAFEYLSRKLFDTAVVTFAGHDFSVEPGWIHAVQAKVTIPMKGSGVKIPLSVSVANRTELLKEKNVRGHIGLTFDLDVLASAVRR
jgi:hypothetical protein